MALQRPKVQLAPHAGKICEIKDVRAKSGLIQLSSNVTHKIISFAYISFSETLKDIRQA